MTQITDPADLAGKTIEWAEQSCGVLFLVFSDGSFARASSEGYAGEPMMIEWHEGPRDHDERVACGLKPGRKGTEVRARYDRLRAKFEGGNG